MLYEFARFAVRLLSALVLLFIIVIALAYAGICFGLLFNHLF